MTSGYLPLGGVIAAPNVVEPFWAGEGHRFAHGATYSGHATCCAAALANLDLLERDDLVHRTRHLERSFYTQLKTLETHPNVETVRGGIGLMAAVALPPALLVDHPDAAARLGRLSREAGLLTRGLTDGVAIAPPLIVEEEHVQVAVAALAQALDALV